MHWMNIFGSYNFLVRTGFATTLVAYGAYVLLRSGTFAVPQIGLMALGEYGSAIAATKLNWPFALDALVGIATGVVVALILGLMLMSLEGIRLAIATIAFDEIILVLASNLSVTGGAIGLTGVPLFTNDLELSLSLLAVVIIAWRLQVSRFGRAMDALRLDSLVAAHQGISIRQYRLAAFAASGFLCSLGGVLEVHTTGFTDPTLFAFTNLTQIIAIVVLGGLSTFYGPIIGAIFILGLPEILTGLMDYQLAFDGLIIVLIMAVAPAGIGGIISQAVKRVASPARDRLARRAVGTETTVGKQTERRLPSRRAEGPAVPAISLRGLTKTFGGLVAVNDVSLDVTRGELFGIIGPNGSGKTTLINIVSGVVPRSSGVVELEGVTVDKRSRANNIARLGVSRTFQGVRLLRNMSVAANVLLGSYSRYKSGLVASILDLRRNRLEQRSLATEARSIMRSLELEANDAVIVGSLPYGLQRRTEIARASLQDPSIMLLDEPTAGMSADETTQIFEYLRAVCRQGRTVVVIEHDLRAMSTHCDRIAVMNEGRLLAVGKPDAVLARPEVVEAYIGHRATDRQAEEGAGTWNS